MPTAQLTLLSAQLPAIDSGSTSGKLLMLLIGVGTFAVAFALILFVGSLFHGRKGEKWQALAFVGPTLLFIAVGLLYPAVLTIRRAFYSGKFFDTDLGTRRTKGEFVGFENFQSLFTTPGLDRVFLNTALWVILVPLLATGLGLLYAILIDRAKGESFAKALIFLPMAISMVGASLIWKFVYDYNGSGGEQVGLLNAVLTKIGRDPINFLQSWAPGFAWNTLFLIVVMIWIQAGFAMTVLSAAIKAIPDDIIEAGKLDGVGGFKMFRYITLPSIRSSLIVVLTTIAIATLKAFDIVQATDGGKQGDSVLANEFYIRSFVTQEPGFGSAIAIVIFLLVVPIIVFNVIQLRKERAA